VARVSGHRCRFVGAFGRLARAGLCARPVYQLARGTGGWSLTLKGRFPRGRYLVLARATDRVGRIELARARGNTTRFRVR